MATPVGRCQLLYLLSRQGLLERYGKTDEFLAEAKWSEVGPLHATSQQTPFLSLLARIEDFTEHWPQLVLQNQAVSLCGKDEELDDKHYSRSRCMRGTLHLLPAHAEPFVAGCYNNIADKVISDFGVDVTKGVFAEWSSSLLHELYLSAANSADRGKGKGQRNRKNEKNTDEEDARAVQQTVPLPSTAVHLRDHFIPKSAKRQCPIYKAKKCKPSLRTWATGCRMKWMLQWLWSKGLVEHGATERLTEVAMKHWRSSQRTWSISSKGAQLLAKGGGDVEAQARHVIDSVLDEDGNAALKSRAELELCIWYFSLYGPASFKDYQWWSGITPVARLRGPFNRLKEGVDHPSMGAPHGPHFKLEQVTVEGMDEVLFMMESQLPQLLSTSNAAISEMARFLPYEDAIIKAYKETRYRFFPSFRYGGTTQQSAVGELTRKATKASMSTLDVTGFKESTVIVRGEAMPTVWLDGCIAGRWKWRNKPGHPLEIDMMIQPSAPQKRLLEDELKRVAVLVQHDAVEWL